MFDVRKHTDLFLSQSYEDSWDDYVKWLETGLGWDYVILTASNEAQAEGYRREIDIRLKAEVLSSKCVYMVLADPDGKRVGSGGATFNVIRELICNHCDGDVEQLSKKRILVIHSGGDSKRIPQYSVCGKLFSPVPRVLPDGRSSTLFDEFMISMAAVAMRFEEGMLVLSGDVLLLFNPLQLDFQFSGAAAISIKEPVSIGKNHGVFLNDGNGYVGKFLHKQSEEQLQMQGAVNKKGNVDLDTGAVLFDKDILTALWKLISIDGVFHQNAFDEFVNDVVRVSFYGDFLYPLATGATLEEYYEQAPEGEMSQALLDCRTKLWEALSPFSMRLLCLSPAKFIHFGTTRELLELVTKQIEEYSYLGWKRNVACNLQDEMSFAVYNSLVMDSAQVGQDSYIENSCVYENGIVGDRTIISNIAVEDMQIPSDVVLHGIECEKGFVVRIYGVEDNPKDSLEKSAKWLGSPVEDVVNRYSVALEHLWTDKNVETHYMWNAALYPVCEDRKEALAWALRVKEIFNMTASEAAVKEWLAMPRMSLCDSFNDAVCGGYLQWNKELESRIKVQSFVTILRSGRYYEESFSQFPDGCINKSQCEMLLEVADDAEFSVRIRIYYALANYLRKFKLKFDEITGRKLEEKCFAILSETICDVNLGTIISGRDWKMVENEVNVQLPVRVNWGGGWTDTPPYCNENGGKVLNAAIKLDGIYPIQVSVKKLDSYCVEFASQDIGVEGKTSSLEDIRNCRNPYDHFALHKAALLACGIVPMENTGENLEDILKRIGGGIHISTKVVGIPKGSGLGTSSILAGACVVALYKLFGVALPQKELYTVVLCLEQIMSTGGGWQDQVGGLTPGIKMITTQPGLLQDIEVETIDISDATKNELQERFALIYTGQRRLARNLLREVVGGYIGAKESSISALEDMKKTADSMQIFLERGDVDEFAMLLNRHWELSLKLDQGATNTCIDQIFASCEDLIDGKFISGAGGGGFLQVILKKGITKQQLDARLYSVFQDSGVCVWDSELCFE